MNNKRVSMHRWLSVWAVLFIVVLSANASAKVTALVDKTELTMDDMLSLTIAVDGNATGAKPDMRQIQDDFDVVSTSANSSISIVNGASTQRLEWHYQLVPLKRGEIVIPAIDVAGERTKPLTVKVVEQAKQPNQQKQLFLEIETKPKQIYVQSQLHVIQRVFTAKALPSNARLSEPETSKGSADVVFLGQRQPYRTNRDGKSYEVIERHFAVYPQKSGELVLAPTIFEGYVSDPNRALRFPFNSFQGRRVRERAPAVTLNVLPQPSQFSGKDWLPAQNVTLHGNWSAELDKLKAGEPITLTLGVIAEGVRAEQLPNISFELPDEIKVYPETPTLQNNKNQRSIVGVKNQKFTLIPSKAGDFSFPDISLPWWNIADDKQDEARLDGQVLKVRGEASNAQAKAPSTTNPMVVQEPLTHDNTAAMQPSSTLNQAGSSLNNVESVSDVDPDSVFSQWTWWELALALLISVLLALALFLVYSLIRRSLKRKADENIEDQSGTQANNKTVSANASSQSKPRQNNQQVYQALQQACQQGQAKQASSLLEQWAEVAMNKQPINLAVIAEEGSPELRSSINELSSALYGRGTGRWRGDKLWQAVENYQHSVKQKPVALDEEGLVSLHPESVVK